MKKKNRNKFRKKKVIKKLKVIRKVKVTRKKKAEKNKNKKKFKTKKYKNKNFKKIKSNKNKKGLGARYNSKNVIFKIIRFQEKLKSKFKFKINFSIEKSIQSFFQKIADKIEEFQIIKAEEKRRRQLEENQKMQRERLAAKKEFEIQKKLELEEKRKELQQEAKLEKERIRDIKLFLRKEQAIIRKEQAEKQRKFLEEIKIEKQIKKFRIREIKELEKLERISLKEQREDYAGLQERIDKLKEKYRIIRDQKIKERVEALGVKLQGDEDRETLLLKEKEYTLARQKIEFALESFYRSASSLVFQLNKRHVTRNMSIFRCIDRRFETGEIFIRWDESEDEEWLLLIYIKNNSPDEGIVIEDKTNPEKNLSHEFRSADIFKASDTMVDSLTQLIARKRDKNNN